MPGYGTSRAYEPLSWENMTRWQRKAFHRENESRVRKGLNPLKKPRVARVEIGDLFYRLVSV